MAVFPLTTSPGAIATADAALRIEVLSAMTESAPSLATPIKIGVSKIQGYRAVSTARRSRLQSRRPKQAGRKIANAEATEINRSAVLLDQHHRGVKTACGDFGIEEGGDAREAFSGWGTRGGVAGRR